MKEYPAVRRSWLFPKALGTALETSLRPARDERGFGQRNLIRDWAQIVGPELAVTTQPMQLIPGRANVESRLVVRAPGALATRIQHLEPVILERLAIYYGYTVAQRLSLVR